MQPTQNYYQRCLCQCLSWQVDTEPPDDGRMARRQQRHRHQLWLAEMRLPSNTKQPPSARLPISLLTETQMVLECEHTSLGHQEMDSFESASYSRDSRALHSGHFELDNLCGVVICSQQDVLQLPGVACPPGARDTPQPLYPPTLSFQVATI